MRNRLIVKSFYNFLVLSGFILFTVTNGLSKTITRVEPAFWWTGMKNDTLQIVVGGKNIGKAKAEINYPGVSLINQKVGSNPDYIFLYLTIKPNTKPGSFNIKFSGKGIKENVNYQLKSRNNEVKAQGYNASDAIYLIMPDRFANGNTANDEIPGMLEGVKRNADFGRHGGDLKGVMNHLDYIKNLGMTAIWLNPVQENDMPKSSYHGYAITDFYNVDRRFGTMEEYLQFVKTSHSKGLKVVQDMVMNHAGTEAWFVKTPPDSNFLNNWPTYTHSNFRTTAVTDPHAAESDVKAMTRGWFDNTMADMNQQNKLMADYLIQNCIWWIEYACIDAIRMDTYPYPDKDFMNRWSREIMNEYPGFTLVGEVWVTQPALAAYFVKDSHVGRNWQGGLPTVTDFPLKDAIAAAVNENGGWESGLAKVYNTLALDFLYETPERNLIFADNHDLTRVATIAKGNFNKFKQAMVMVATLRGVPEVYYGTEIFMEGEEKYHPSLRRDFPGGWAGDSASVLENRNLSSRQTEALSFIKNLFNWRKTNSAIHTGKLIQYIPEDNIYVYFRLGNAPGKGVATIINGNNETKQLKLKRFAELQNVKSGREIISQSEINLSQPEISLPSQGALVIEY